MTTPSSTAGAAPVEVAPKSGAASTFVAIAIGLMILLGWVLRPGWNFVAILALMVLMVVLIGFAITGRPLGVFVSEQNVMSLSRFQMVAWTVVVLSAYLAYVLGRMRAGTGAYQDPLAVAIDWRLWALMGISTTSLVGTSVILTTKKDKDPKAEAVDKVAAKLGEAKDIIDANRHGLLYVNDRQSDARFTDMFQGDEIGNTAHIDMAKVQMFYFTIISVAAFAFIVATTLPAGDLSQLPQLPDGLVALLGISHAGYLGAKGVTKTQTN